MGEPRRSSPTITQMTSSLGRSSSHDSIPTEDIIPGPYEVGDDTPQTYFRTLTQGSIRLDLGRPEGEHERKARILSRRGALKWLPMHGFSGDLPYAMIWFVWASVFTTAIPILPLIALTENVLWDSPESVLSESEHIGLYGVMIFCGVCWTLASWIFGRAVESEAVKPLCWNIWCCSTDELLSTWLIVAGIAPTIPVMALYLHHNPDNLEWQLGLLGAVICTLLSLIFVYFFLPRESKAPIRNFISPLFLGCFSICPRNSLKKHVQNDLLILCWFSVWGCLLCCVLTFFASMYSINVRAEYEIYEYSTICVNCLMYLVASMYFTAGSYPSDLIGGLSNTDSMKVAGPIVGVIGGANAALEV